MPIFTTPDGKVKINYSVHGKGPQGVLLIMGLLTDGAAWHFQTEHIAENANYQVVSYDNRGVGGSSSPYERFTTSKMALDALALVNFLNWDSFHLVGVSMGGMIAQELSLLIPHRILSLSLFVTHAGGLPARPPLTGVYKLFQSLFMASDDRSRLNGICELLYGPISLQDPQRRTHLYSYHAARLAKRIPPHPIGMLGHFCAVLTHFVSYSHLLQIRYNIFPILIITGTHDTLVRPENSHLLHEVLGGELVVLDGAGHGLPSERPDEINSALTKHFELGVAERVAAISLLSKGSPQTSSLSLSSTYGYRESKWPCQYKAVSLCCSHRTHCSVHCFLSMAKGWLSGFLFRFLFGDFLGMNNNDGPLTSSFKFALLIACLRGFSSSFLCLYKGIRSRLYVNSLSKSEIGIDTKSQIPSATFPQPYWPAITLAATIALFATKVKTLWV